MTPTTIATAADYADAMLTARRAKNLLFWLLLLFLLLQITLFFLIRFDVIKVQEDPSGGSTTVASGVTMTATVDEDGSSATQPAATQPADDDTRVVQLTASPRAIQYLLDYGTGLIVFLGMIFVILLAAILMLLLTVMLVGRLIGVSQVTSAFIWSVLLALILFPWQIFYDNPRYEPARLPGALYTWSELESNVHFGMDPSPGAAMEWPEQWMKWGRFVVFPAVAVILLLMIQTRSSRGLRMALGESDVSVTVDEHGAP